MRQRYRFTPILALLVLVPLTWAAEHQYSTARILDIQHKTRQKTDLYLVNTPVQAEVPYVEMTVRVGQTEFTAEYTPHHDEQLPAAWIAGADVPVRIEKHMLYAQRPDGTEVRLIITKKRPAKEPH